MTSPREERPTAGLRKVLLVGQGRPATGGIPEFLQGLLDSDLNRLFDIRLLNLTRGSVSWPGRLRFSNIFRTLIDARRVWSSARSVDLIHINSALAPLVTLIRIGLLSAVGRARGFPVVVHVHSGLIDLWFVTRARRLLARALLKPARRIVAASAGSYAALAQGFPEGRVHLIENGIDLQAHAGIPSTHEPPVILYAGVVIARKGVLDLVTASTLLRTRGVTHRLVLAGALDPHTQQARRLRLAMGGHAQILGHVDRSAMRDLYARADLLCLPSWWEAMPLAVLEAMASGLPVVATSVGDLPRIVHDGVTGTLVPPHDPPALADALESLLCDPALRLRMGAAARRRVERHFDLSVTCSKIGAMYEELLS